MKNKRLVLSILIVIGIFLISYGTVFAAGKVIMDSAHSDSSENADKKTSAVKKEKSDIQENSTDSKTSKDGNGKNTHSTSSDTVSENTQEENSDRESEASSEKEQSSESSDTSKESATSESDPDQSDGSSSDSAENDGHSPELLSSLDSAGYSVDDLAQVGCKQLVTVNSSGSDATVSFYQLNADGIWEQDTSLTTEGYVGSRGVSKDSHEGSYETPFGLHGIGDAFYIDNAPETSLNTFQVTEDTYWVDDPGSKFYNKRVEGIKQKDWNSAEHMIEYYSSYRYGFVIEFNTQNIVPGRGSAFFFHISWEPTAGCVGVSETMMLEYLRKLDSSMSPYILIQ